MSDRPLVEAWRKDNALVRTQYLESIVIDILGGPKVPLD
jgi:hypothetical protein